MTYSNAMLIYSVLIALFYHAYEKNMTKKKNVPMVSFFICLCKIQTHFLSFSDIILTICWDLIGLMFFISNEYILYMKYFHIYKGWSISFVCLFVFKIQKFQKEFQKKIPKLKMIFPNLVGTSTYLNMWEKSVCGFMNI